MTSLSDSSPYNDDLCDGDLCNDTFSDDNLPQ